MGAGPGWWPICRWAAARPGIVGLGPIGTQIARRLEAFGPKIVWHGPRPKPEAAWPHQPDPVALARWADVLILACAAAFLEGRVPPIPVALP